MVTSKQEALWVLRPQCDDREALQLLLRSVQPTLHRYLTSVVGAAAADDVLQDVLIVLYRKLRWLHAPELFRPWAYRVASRTAFRYLRKEKRWSGQVRDESVLGDVPAPELTPSSELLQEILGMDEISPVCRTVLVLHFQEDLTLQEVAAVLEIPLGTVKSRLAYGLAAVRKKLKSNNQELPNVSGK